MTQKRPEAAWLPEGELPGDGGTWLWWVDNPYRTFLSEVYDTREGFKVGDVLDKGADVCDAEKPYLGNVVSLEGAEFEKRRWYGPIPYWALAEPAKAPETTPEIEAPAEPQENVKINLDSTVPNARPWKLWFHPSQWFVGGVLPEHEGFYWVRDENKRWDICRVYETADGYLVMERFAEAGKLHILSDPMMNFLWEGPILPSKLPRPVRKAARRLRKEQKRQNQPEPAGLPMDPEVPGPPHWLPQGMTPTQPGKYVLFTGEAWHVADVEFSQHTVPGDAVWHYTIQEPWKLGRTVFGEKEQKYFWYGPLPE
jgi:hypothetical protein